jgi:7-carboxy-7-deazaguanine synthase
VRINEIFLSVQGETSSIGLPTIFVRAAGCPLRCTYCDTPYALTTQESVQMSVDEIMAKVRELKVKRVCYTGGEPLIQPKAEIQAFFDRLAEEGYELSIETSGAFPIQPFHLHEKQRWIFDLKAPSSGESHRMDWDSLAHLRPQDEVKFVIGSRADFDWAVEQVRQYDLDGRVGLIASPVWNEVTPLQLTEWVLASGIDFRVQVQLHKIIWDPSQRGV